MKKTVYRPNSLYGRMYYNRENSPGRHGVRHQKAFGILRPEPTNYCSNLLFRYRNAMEKHHHLPISFHPLLRTRHANGYTESGHPLCICLVRSMWQSSTPGNLHHHPDAHKPEVRSAGARKHGNRGNALPMAKVPFPLPYSRLQCVRRYFVTIVCLLSCRASASGSPPCLVRLQTRTSYQQPEHPYPLPNNPKEEPKP